MIYDIVYDKGTRLRVRAGKDAFTEGESYGLTSVLLEYDFIDECLISHRNGSILIYYNDPEKKGTILIVKRYLFKIILPIPLRRIRLLAHAIPYIWRGLDSLTSFRIDVALLDGTAIAASLYKGNFNSVGSMIFLLGISDLLEDYTMQKTKNTLKNSLALNVDNVWVVECDDEGNEVESLKPLSKVKKGEKVRIRTGAIIPVDGVIADGDAMINEASMTGESLAVHKTEGRAVHAGTVVEEGSIIIEVSSVNEETRLNKIIQMIEDSEDLKAGVHSKAEKLADSIVPYSLLLTALTYLITRNSVKALSVLMVDFSCAIKLTTPISVISAMKEASDNRMMVKGGKFLEAYSTADTIVFDKTGTLTNASPKLAKVIPCGKYERDEVLRISACIHSEVEYIVAHGISTKYHGKKAIIGSRHFVEEDEGIKFTKKQKELIEEQVAQYSVIYLAIGKKLQGILCIEDPVREEAHDVIQELKSLGIENVVMLTGDSENAASKIASDLGLTRYKSQVLPEDKANIINSLKKEGHQVIMVGDGINDSPLYDLITLRKLSVGMIDKINANYRHIVMFNGTLLALGIFGLITPGTSSLLHNLSTMLFGVRSTRSVLNSEEPVLLEAK